MRIPVNSKRLIPIVLAILFQDCSLSEDVTAGFRMSSENVSFGAGAPHRVET